MANSLGYIACLTLAVFWSVQTAQAWLPIPEPECGPVCLILCPCGNELDYRGCPICSCKPCPPTDCGPICAMACPCGFEVDYRGCPICFCKSCEGPVEEGTGWNGGGDAMERRRGQDGLEEGTGWIGGGDRMEWRRGRDGIEEGRDRNGGGDGIRMMGSEWRRRRDWNDGIGMEEGT